MGQGFAADCEAGEFVAVSFSRAKALLCPTRRISQLVCDLLFEPTSCIRGLLRGFFQDSERQARQPSCVDSVRPRSDTGFDLVQQGDLIVLQGRRRPRSHSPVGLARAEEAHVTALETGDVGLCDLRIVRHKEADRAKFGGNVSQGCLRKGAPVVGARAAPKLVKDHETPLRRISDDAIRRDVSLVGRNEGADLRHDGNQRDAPHVAALSPHVWTRDQQGRRGGGGLGAGASELDVVGNIVRHQVLEDRMPSIRQAHSSRAGVALVRKAWPDIPRQGRHPSEGGHSVDHAHEVHQCRKNAILASVVRRGQSLHTKPGAAQTRADAPAVIPPRLVLRDDHLLSRLQEALVKIRGSCRVVSKHALGLRHDAPIAGRNMLCINSVQLHHVRSSQRLANCVQLCAQLPFRLLHVVYGMNETWEGLNEVRRDRHRVFQLRRFALLRALNRIGVDGLQDGLHVPLASGWDALKRPAERGERSFCLHRLTCAPSEGFDL
eukprot:scaffold135_cov249-Pinguiococcus_pyrenoidosus.AAC.6